MIKNTALIFRKIILRTLTSASLSVISSPLFAYDAQLNALLHESSELMQLGQADEALLLLKEKEAAYRESREFMNNLAVAYLSNSNPELALSILRQLVENDPLYSIITHNLLEVELQIGDAREDKIKPVFFVQTVESFFNEELAGATPDSDAAPQPSETAREIPTATAESIILATAFVDNWASAWSSKDYQSYINQYSQRFTGTNGENFDKWAQFRSTRLNKPGSISVQISNLQVEPIDNDQLRVTFDQAYRSANYSDRVLKELVLTQEGTDWKILRESTLTEY